MKFTSTKVTHVTRIAITLIGKKISKSSFFTTKYTILMKLGIQYKVLM